jgi:hypothetical protein
MRPKSWVFASILVAMVCLFGGYFIVTRLWPDPDIILGGPQLLLLIFLFAGLGAAATPVNAFLNHRFAKPGWAERDKLRLARQGAWVGFWGVLLAYLQLIKALNWTIAIVLAGVFILIEIFLLTRG